MGVVVNEGMRLWHVKVTMAGPAMEPAIVRRALQRFADERPFLDSLHYARDRAEIAYWDEAETIVDAGSLALRLWTEHRTSANLPPWEVVGLEVVEREARVAPVHLSSVAVGVLPVPL